MRKYALTRLDKGDYLCASNDGETLYRFRTYHDGPSFGLMDWPRDRLVWSVERTEFGTFLANPTVPVNELDWRNVSGPHDTRRVALASVFGEDDQ